MLTDSHNRGVQDILIACVDGLKGFPKAIQAIFPNTEVQLCVIHQIPIAFVMWQAKIKKPLRGI